MWYFMAKDADALFVSSDVPPRKEAIRVCSRHIGLRPLNEVSLVSGSYICGCHQVPGVVVPFRREVMGVRAISVF